MTTHLQLVADIETRDKYDSAVITRIAITPFRYEEDKNITFKELVDRTLYLSLNQDEQIAKGRTVATDTEAWWATQSEELRIESYYPTDEDISIIDAFAEIKRFLSRWNYNHFYSFLYARNCGFESFKIQSLNEMFLPDTKQVLNNWNWHEVKSFNYILSGGETQKWTPPNIDELGFQYHNAAHDSAMDAYRLIKLWNGEA